MVQSSTELPWPVEWASPVRRRWIGLFVILAGITLVVGGFGTIQFVAGRFEGLVILGFTPIFGVAALTALISRLRIRRRGGSAARLVYVQELREWGVSLPYSAALTVLYLGIMAWLLAVCCALALLGCWLAFDGGIGVVSVLTIGLFGGIAAYASRFCLHVVLGKFARGFVALTPSGVYHRSWAYSSFFPWDEVRFVTAVEAQGPVVVMAMLDPGNSWFRRGSRLWRQEELAFSPHLAVRGMFLAVDPALVYHALRYYHHTPGARKELSSAAGLARVREGGLWM